MVTLPGHGPVLLRTATWFANWEYIYHTWWPVITITNGLSWSRAWPPVAYDLSHVGHKICRLSRHRRSVCHHLPCDDLHVINKCIIIHNKVILLYVYHNKVIFYYYYYCCHNIIIFYYYYFYCTGIMLYVFLRSVVFYVVVYTDGFFRERTCTYFCIVPEAVV